MTESTFLRRSELLRDVTQLRLLGDLREDRGDIVTFERTPLLLSKRERTDALAGRAVWLEDPAGWFATDESDIETLTGWMPHYVAPYFYIAKNHQSCWRCGETSPVYCLASTGDYLERRQDFDDEDHLVKVVEWNIAEYGSFVGTFISNMTMVNGKVGRFIKERCSSYYVDYSKMASSSYYMNHCVACDAKFGDFFMHNEPGGAFSPMSENEARSIQLSRIDLPLLVQGSASFSSPDMLPYCTCVD
ncbi:conserved hypothetical protein [Burkholderia diffusa]|uniref:hypothetical protein n=1 Tax=Burkholderia diffusa TaxID=488732 RepID=UPI001CB05C66|nr:hypothetical protein [Burkholderia diffusa]CAG9266202.1 conserved hypothetical protein [Burkholderia diffusa]